MCDVTNGDAAVGVQQPQLNWANCNARRPAALAAAASANNWLQSIRTYIRTIIIRVLCILYISIAVCYYLSSGPSWNICQMKSLTHDAARCACAANVARDQVTERRLIACSRARALTWRNNAYMHMMQYYLYVMKMLINVYYRPRGTYLQVGSLGLPPLPLSLTH